MGKGGCELVEAGANCIRGLLCCFCCAVCAGPILLIVGVVLLAAPNNYKQYVDSYNAKVTTFNNDYKNLIQQTSGSVSDGAYQVQVLSSGSSTPLSPQFSGKLPSADSAQDVQGTPLSFPLKSTSNVPLSSSQSASITFTPDNASSTSSGLIANTVNFTLPAISTVTTTVDIHCSSDDIDRRRTCQSLCQRKSSCATYSGSGTCYSRSSCSGSCSVRKYQTMSCTTFSIDNSTGRLSRSSSGSCLYPFTNNKQPESCDAPSNSAVPVVFMSEDDPFIQIQKILGDDSFSFGLTKEQQRNLSLALIGVGASITALVFGGAYCLYKMIYKDEKTATKVYSAFGRTYTPSGASPNNTAYSPQAQYGQQPATGNYYDNSQQHNNNNNMAYQQHQAPPPPQQQQYYQQQQPPPQQQQYYGGGGDPNYNQNMQYNNNNNNFQQQPQQQPQPQGYGYSAQPPPPQNMAYGNNNGQYQNAPPPPGGYQPQY